MPGIAVKLEVRGQLAQVNNVHAFREVRSRLEMIGKVRGLGHIMDDNQDPVTDEDRPSRQQLHGHGAAHQQENEEVSQPDLGQDIEELPVGAPFPVITQEYPINTNTMERNSA